MSSPATSLVASTSVGAYSQAMVALRLLRFLTLVALLIAPLRMMSAHAEMAMPAPADKGHHMAAAATSDHCGGGMNQPRKDQPASGIDCTIACSACPSAESTLIAHPHPAAPIPPATLASALIGLHPESDPPPPRLA